ncbi:MAG: hypothetical protein HYT27_01825 [Parcubacteria group bacterium]|nr:hypothetical protein [Parcubacteria group bacterium]
MKNNFFFFASFVVSFLLISGCAERYQFTADKPIAQSLPSPSLTEKYFGYTKNEARVHIMSHKPFRESGEESLLQLTSKNTGVATAHYTTPDTSKNNNVCKKLVIILPIYNSKHTYPQKALALRLLFREEKDIAVLVIKDPTYPVNFTALAAVRSKEELAHELQKFVQEMRKRVIIVRQFIDWAETQKEICKNRIGIVGFSAGVPFASNAMSADGRISSGVFVMGGGELHNVFAFGGAGDIMGARSQILKRFSWTEEVFAQFIEPFFEGMNPELYAGNIDPRRVLYIDSAHDDFIPKTAIERLWEALGKPERVRLPFGHKFSFIFMTPFGLDYINVAIDSFFEKKL